MYMYLHRVHTRPKGTSTHLFCKTFYDNISSKTYNPLPLHVLVSDFVTNINTF